MKMTNYLTKQDLLVTEEIYAIQENGSIELDQDGDLIGWWIWNSFGDMEPRTMITPNSDGTWYIRPQANNYSNRAGLKLTQPRIKKIYKLGVTN